MVMVLRLAREAKLTPEEMNEIIKAGDQIRGSNDLQNLGIQIKMPINKTNNKMDFIAEMEAENLKKAKEKCLKIMQFILWDPSVRIFYDLMQKPEETNPVNEIRFVVKGLPAEKMKEVDIRRLFGPSGSEAVVVWLDSLIRVFSPKLMRAIDVMRGMAKFSDEGIKKLNTPVHLILGEGLPPKETLELKKIVGFWRRKKPF